MKASEIHKKRTGKALKITEDVVRNDKIYEEEDGEVPSRYRHLIPHLSTGSQSFDDRLNSYLTSVVAFRAALGEAAREAAVYANSEYQNSRGYELMAGSNDNNTSNGNPTTSPAPVRQRTGDFYAFDDNSASRVGHGEGRGNSSYVKRTNSSSFQRSVPYNIDASQSRTLQRGATANSINTTTMVTENDFAYLQNALVQEPLGDEYSPFTLELPANEARMFPRGYEPVHNPDVFFDLATHVQFTTEDYVRPHDGLKPLTFSPETESKNKEIIVAATENSQSPNGESRSWDEENRLFPLLNLDDSWTSFVNIDQNYT